MISEMKKPILSYNLIQPLAFWSDRDASLSADAYQSASSLSL